MKNVIEEVAIAYKIDKQQRNFPDHVCAMSNRVAASSGELSTLTNLSKYGKSEIDKKQIKEKAISVIVQALRLIEEIEK